MSALDENNRWRAPGNAASPERERPFQFRLVHLLAAVTLFGAALAIIVPIYRTAHESNARLHCVTNLKHIALALQSYHDTYRCFPAAFECDSNGKPAHSWRVAIWPFMMRDPSYLLYSYAEPWNGPNNSRIVTQMANVYRCPSDRNHAPGITNYVAVVGPGTMWPGAAYISMSDITDGTDKTIMVVEITNSDIHWMEPRDLPIEELRQWLDPKHKPTLLASHGRGRIRGGIVAFPDGHTELLPRDVTEKRLRALLSPAGNDAADAAEYDSEK